jgi:hypothetical protein
MSVAHVMIKPSWSSAFPGGTATRIVALPSAVSARRYRLCGAYGATGQKAVDELAFC